MAQVTVCGRIQPMMRVTVRRKLNDPYEPTASVSYEATAHMPMLGGWWMVAGPATSPMQAGMLCAIHESEMTPLNVSEQESRSPHLSSAVIHPAVPRDA